MIFGSTKLFERKKKKLKTKKISFIKRCLKSNLKVFRNLCWLQFDVQSINAIFHFIICTTKKFECRNQFQLQLHHHKKKVQLILPNLRFVSKCSIFSFLIQKFCNPNDFSIIFWKSKKSNKSILFPMNCRLIFERFVFN